MFMFMLLAVISLRLFVGEICTVPSPSMSPTIITGDWLWIDKVTYGAQLPRRFADIPVINVFTWIKSLRLADEKNDWGDKRLKGLRMPCINDVAVFQSPEYPFNLLVKRISAIISKGDTIFLNMNNYDAMQSIILYEGYDISFRNDSIFLNRTPDSICVVSQPYYYMRGDNSSNSVDSRAFGYIPFSSIVGRMNCVVFSLNTDNNLFDMFRWNRFFKTIAPTTKSTKRCNPDSFLCALCEKLCVLCG